MVNVRRRGAQPHAARAHAEGVAEGHMRADQLLLVAA